MNLHKVFTPILVWLLSGCLSTQKTIYIDDKALDTGEYVSWHCYDTFDDMFIKSLIVVGHLLDSVVGHLLDSEVSSGFIFYHDSRQGAGGAYYHREGINHRWDWGEYSFIIEPDGSGLYYDFSNVPTGETTKASNVFQCK